MKSSVAKPAGDTLYGALSALTGVIVIPKRPTDTVSLSLTFDNGAPLSFSFTPADPSESTEQSKSEPDNASLTLVFEDSKTLHIAFATTDTKGEPTENNSGCTSENFSLYNKGQKVDDKTLTLADLGIKHLDITTKHATPLGAEPSILTVPDDMFDPEYDCDFTNINDSKESLKRGGLPYYKPCGCKRYALKVIGKYDDGNDTWLGSTNSPGEWAVSYHGTSNTNAEPIVKWGLKVGFRNAYGRGIYCTPNVRTALAYSQVYTEKNTGKEYKIVFQNRVRVEAIHRASDKGGPADYWYVPETTDIRPYGICVYEKW